MPLLLNELPCRCQHLPTDSHLSRVEPAVAEWLWNRVRSLVFTTGLPPMVAAASVAAVGVVASGEGDRLRVALRARVAAVVEGLAELGLLARADAGVLVIVVGDDRRAMECTARLLEGGVTTVQVLPGSANLFGGRSVVLKLVPARTVQEMKFPNAKYGLKMACGENPKRVYAQRGPSTRMGNVAGYRDQWIKAERYRRKWDAWLADRSGERAAHVPDHPPRQAMPVLVVHDIRV